MRLSRADSTLRFLLDLQFFGIKAGLDNIRAILSFLGNPERRFPSVHIAGTNGKGSTAAMIASILTASGYRTGLYTSPHLVEFEERIRIDGRKIPRGEVLAYTESIKPAIRQTRATFFEATTAIAFKYFQEEKVDVAVIETGLGGRWDATNVILPELSVITNIGLDHTEYLGNTLSRIAFEKGGIIKPGVPCLTGVTQRGPLRVLRNLARLRGSELMTVTSSSPVSLIDRSLTGIRVNLRTSERVYKDLEISLPGDHQARNAQLAVTAAEEMGERGGFGRVSGSRIKGGLASIRENTGLRGRLELLRTDPFVIVDVAHNPDGTATLTRALKALGAGSFLVVFGVMRDKDYHGMIEALAPFTRLAFGVRPHGVRALETGTILRGFHSNGCGAVDGGTVREGFEDALREARDGEAILVTGSHYVAGELLKSLNFDV